ncbi:carbon-nitrogen hydrolase family protein [Reichenbachiella carrageenanivorans]|uniref:Carbon-nitrogen hydrolase family protein n=1 Tax=Reichenbachiella carrageenanivorans TaxID=2979869 RepID=A0ABY6CZ65_9BACT|nr:carbon-nitrogen hydrolase family protein [Reichenbachiella carrageenanivorans]UXX79206.1 carbon-nitrogen hydrolase family protein [Reichenbachiella carrageenanivorans]
MIISLAQTSPIKNSLTDSLNSHKAWVTAAVKEKSDCILFPELSITGYEPTTAHQNAVSPEVQELMELQAMSDQHDIIIGVGMPIKTGHQLTINLIIFAPNAPVTCYAKQHLHPDETPYFASGDRQVIFKASELKIAPAICYESLKEEHLEHCKSLGAKVYAASVAKSERGLTKAYDYYAYAAKKYSIPILMCNCVGTYDHMICTGQSAIWNDQGELVASLDSTKKALLVYNTQTNQAYKRPAPSLNHMYTASHTKYKT